MMTRSHRMWELWDGRSTVTSQEEGLASNTPEDLELFWVVWVLSARLLPLSSLASSLSLRTSSSKWEYAVKEEALSDGVFPTRSILKKCLLLLFLSLHCFLFLRSLIPKNCLSEYYVGRD